jgi:uncharacterized protein
MNTQGAVIVFSKAPVAGQVKSRLIPELGLQGAAALYQELLTKTLNTVINSGCSEIQLWVSGDMNHQFFTNIKNKQNVTLFEQKGEDLGSRMSHAFNSVLKKHPYAVLIGSDCPSLQCSDLQKGMEYLENGKDVVIGPAEDGGYYLIGLRKNEPEIFSDIEWGEKTVFSETCMIIEDINLDVGLLAKRRDIDRPSDLHAYFKLTKQESTSDSMLS